MDLTKTAISLLGVPISWNGIFNWLFLVASTITLFIAIVLQIIQAIKSKKTDK
ncbi:MAG: hypothetical protein PHX78_01555 [bacterium]|nr:hypothetical protein [bacterium]